MEASESDFHLTGIVTERSQIEGTHWLMFLFELRFKIEALPNPHPEGEFQFFDRSALEGIEVPKTDRDRLWPWFWRHRGGYYAARCIVEHGASNWVLSIWVLSILRRKLVKYEPVPLRPLERIVPYNTYANTGAIIGYKIKQHPSVAICAERFQSMQIN